MHHPQQYTIFIHGYSLLKVILLKLQSSSTVEQERRQQAQFDGNLPNAINCAMMTTTTTIKITIEHPYPPTAEH
ncbi:hypothetical protein T4B_14243 [Trichinella pseudospiralis]|uniref:Uncharacterized protein n=1 Tax=Trichinella pseudospiralis TaxID=6337 RepID=A0A0V1EGK5_TRIPS|nr:hypothetical protein T4A_6572 [Trichinella pseudospiralis]KRZ20421.1 hypothetical protein T4B_14243 [Trichinella pseudospiralis]KRZ40891.1 hypothetical protein T4C_1981 [Trichinella pseudospiralis]